VTFEEVDRGTNTLSIEAKPGIYTCTWWTWSPRTDSWISSWNPELVGVTLKL
jgi:hypothetical protein